MTENEVTEDVGFVLSPTVYDTLRAFVQMIIPGLSTLYFTLGALWGFPAVEQVVGSLAALVTFGGLILARSRRNYNASDAPFAGTFVPRQKDDGGTLYTLVLNPGINPEGLGEDGRKTLTFKVQE